MVHPYLPTTPPPVYTACSLTPRAARFSPSVSTMASPMATLLLLLTALLQGILSFPLSDLFSASNYEFYPSSVHTLPDTSVLLVSGSTYRPSEVGLHPSVVVPDRDDQDFHLLLRVFRKSGFVVWARAISRYQVGMYAALLSPEKVAVVGYPAVTLDLPPGFLSVCLFAVSDGAEEKCVTSKPPGATALPFMVAVDRSTVLMPAGTVGAEEPAVVQLDLTSGKYGPPISLGDRKEQLPDESELYGAYSAADEAACFLTSREADLVRGQLTYDLSVHCFNPASPSALRTARLGNVPSFRSARHLHLATGGGYVFVSYEQTVRRARGLVSEVINHKLSSTTMEPVPWIENNGLPIPRVVELPQADDRELAPDASTVEEVSYVRLRGGVALRVWSALNITGKFTLKNNRIVMAGTGKYVVQRPQQWVFFLGRKRWPVVRALPVSSNSKMLKGVVPEEYGRLSIGGTSISVSGRKLIAFGMLERVPEDSGSGPLLTYDIHVPYMQM